MAHREISNHLLAPKIQVAIFKAQVLADRILAQWKRQNIRAVKDLERIGDNFDFACRELGIFGSRQSRSNYPLDLNDVLRAKSMRDGSGIWVFLRTKNHLRDPVTVAEIDEYHTAVITAGINPAAKNGRASPNPICAERRNLSSDKS